MKKIRLREVILLTLPVVLFVGLGWWKNQQVEPPEPELPFPATPTARLLFTPFEKVPVTPLDVFRGTDWKARTTLELQGDAELPPSLKGVGVWESETNAQIVYRRGAVWKTIDSSVSGIRLQGGTGRNGLFVKTSFNGVPSDATEVRLRGRIRRFKWFTGTLPFNWKPPQNFQVGMSGYLFTIQSKPFDLSIKAPGKPLPISIVSHRPLVELRGAKWFVGTSPSGPQHNFLLHLHHLSKANWDFQDVTIDNAQLHDADNRGVTLYEKNGKGQKYVMKPLNPGALVTMSQLKSGHDLVVLLLDDGVSPRGGWRQTKQPLRLSLDLSDGTCWPTHFSVIFRPELVSDEKLRKFGVAPSVPLNGE